MRGLFHQAKFAFKKNGDAPVFISVIRHAKNYFTANLALKALGIFSMPIITRLLTTSEYGTIAVFFAWGMIFIPLLSLNTADSVGRYYYEDTDDFPQFVSTSIILVLGIFSSCSILILSGAQFFGDLLELSAFLIPYLILFVFLSIAGSIYSQILIPQKKSGEYSTLQVITGFFKIVLAIGLIYMLSHDRFMGRIWAELFVSLIAFGYIAVKIRGYIIPAFRLDHVRYILKYSVPLIPYSLSGMILAQFDRIMINKIDTIENTGLYSLAYSVGMLNGLVISALNTASMPDFFKFMREKKYGKWDALARKIMSLSAVAALGLVLFSKELVTILADQKFHAGLPVVPIVVIGSMLMATATFYARYIGYAKKTVFSSINLLTAGIANIVLNAIFIPRYGYIAAAYTTVASYFVWFVMSWFTVKFILKEVVTPLHIIWAPVLYLLGFVYIFHMAQLYVAHYGVILVIKIVLLALFSALMLWNMRSHTTNSEVR